VALTAAAAVVVAAAPAARAQDAPLPPPTSIAGSPMTISIGSQGQLQAVRAGDAGGIFFPTSSSLGDAGFFLAFPPASGQSPDLTGDVYGFVGQAGPYLTHTYTPLSQQPATGSGTAADPYRLVTTYAVESTPAGDPAATPTKVATITQTTSYVNGAEDFDVHWDVTNDSPQPLIYKAIAAADFYFEGSDRGTGVFTPGPPRFIGGTNADTGRSGGNVEVTSPATQPWSAYQATAFPDIWNPILSSAADSTAPSLDDSVLGEQDDNAGGVEWDQQLTSPLAPHATQGYELVVRSAAPAALQFDRTNAGAPQGVPITFVVTAKDTSGQPFTGKPIRYAITGVNPLTGTSTVGADGSARIVDPGSAAGADTVVAYVDLNGDGTREPSEPQASALATFVDNVPPHCAVKVTGDRPGGGGAGKPLVISVSCDSPATITTVSTFTITPPKAKAKHARKAAAASAKRPPKHAKKRKAKKIVVKLPATSASVAPGTAAPVDIKVPAAVAKKYGGGTVSATVVVTATDSAGNKASTTAKRTIKLRAYKAPKKKHPAKKKPHHTK